MSQGIYRYRPTVNIVSTVSMNLDMSVRLLDRLPPNLRAALTKWFPGWQRRGWRTSSNKPVQNADLLRHLLFLLGRRSTDSIQARRAKGLFGAARCQFFYIPGHQGHEGNERADMLANQGATLDIVPDRTDWKTEDDIDAPVLDVEVEEVGGAEHPSGSSTATEWDIVVPDDFDLTEEELAAMP